MNGFKTNSIRFCCLILCQIAFFSLTAQVSENMTLQSIWDDPSNTFYNDIWGYTSDGGNEYAIIGSRSKVHFVDVTDPTTPTLKTEFTPGYSSTWRDFKSYDRFVYGISDSGSGTQEGLIIWDMSALPSGDIVQVYQSTADFGVAHNIYIDVPNARLYVVGSNTNLIIYDLSVNPANPTLLASTSVEGGYIHDIFVQNNIAYASSGNDGLYVFDVNDVNNITLKASLVTGAYNHSSWIYEDGSHVVYAEENANRPLGIIDLAGVDNNDLVIKNTFHFPLLTGETGHIFHNPFIWGNYVITSSYEDGVVIYDVTDPNNPSRVGHYDTFPSNSAYSGFDGCWGTYPYFPSGTIVGADSDNGLFVLSTSINLPTGRCGNGVQDAFEQGVDCGGFCEPCGTAASCTDGIQNGSETGVDCGGVCNPCPPTCTDGILNGDEIGIDCGGSNCPACPDLCNDGIQNSDEIGIDCGGSNCPVCPPEDCSTYVFAGEPLSYASQDNGTAVIQDNGATLYMEGNAWKAVPFNYQVTQNTVLEFDFKSTSEGEIHEISFDTDYMSFNLPHRIVVYGTDYGGTFATPNYSGSGDFEHFTIEIGANFTGTFEYLVLTCDDDANAAGNSFFSNIKIYEDYDNSLTCNTTSACLPNETITGIVPSSTYQTSNTLTSSGMVASPNNVTYGANIICLENGFEVELGAEFLGEINPCVPFTTSPTPSVDRSQQQYKTASEEILDYRKYRLLQQ